MFLFLGNRHFMLKKICFIIFLFSISLLFLTNCDEAEELSGCTTATACNYAEAAAVDDESCVYASGCDSCSGETDGTGTVVDGDADDDGVCDTDEVAACTVSTALPPEFKSIS
tara:strand:+ start:2042 stop:2380 length:339 start_codon:yes stop_codon:yes gene_type:complete